MLPASPSNVGVPRLCVGVPLVVYPVALLNGGGGGVCVVLSSDWVLPFTLFLSLLHCLSLPLLLPSTIVFAVTALLVWGVCFLTWLCHCGIAVMVCVAEGCVVCAHLSVCVVMTVCDDSACLVLSHCVVDCGMAAG